MVVLVVLGALFAVTSVWVGARLVLAGRQVEHGAGQGSTAATVDRRLHSARARVETLVMPEIEAAELRPSPGAHQLRAQTYSVLGLGLLGLAGAVAIGVLLLL